MAIESATSKLLNLLIKLPCIPAMQYGLFYPYLALQKYNVLAYREVYKMNLVTLTLTAWLVFGLVLKLCL